MNLSFLPLASQVSSSPKTEGLSIPEKDVPGLPA